MLDELRVATRAIIDHHVIVIAHRARQHDVNLAAQFIWLGRIAVRYRTVSEIRSPPGRFGAWHCPRQAGHLRSAAARNEPRYGCRGTAAAQNEPQCGCGA